MATAEMERAGEMLGAGVAGRHRLETRVVDLNARDVAVLVRAAVDAGGEIWLRASGASMSPTIQDGEQVLLARVGPIRVGDVVLVETGERVVLHRVTSVRGGRVVTCGDACLAPDPEARPERVVARALASCRTAEPARPVTALAWTLRFGAAALARWGLLRTRLAMARAWRTLHRWRARGR